MQASDIAQRKLKFQIIMPAIIIPFLVLLFYSLGGGKGKKEDPQQQAVKGLNPTVPSPALDEKKQDKMTLYEQAEKDSLEKERSSQYDPFSAWMPKPDSNEIVYANKPEQKVENKLTELQQILNSKEPEQALIANPTYSDNQARQMRDLENLISNYQQRAPEEQDNELAQMDSMLEKILDIQHPERVKDRMSPSSEHKQQQQQILTTSNPQQENSNRFYELEEDHELSPASTTIHAVVDRDQELVSGATAVFRLSEDCYISSTMIPAGTLLYGECSLNNERLNCTIKSIQYRNNNYPVSLNVLDAKDGITGIYIPGAITRDVAKQGTNDAIQNLQLATLDQSLGAQATSAAIETAKKLITRKTRLIKATLKAGHPVLLISNKND